jgi:outer membrane cobalamin receptor
MCQRILLILLFLTVNAFSQQNLQPGNRPLNDGEISGRVLDAAQEVPIEYVNVILFRASDSTQATGTITNPQGIFRLENVKPGDYYLKLLFIGYDVKIINEIKITKNIPSTRLGRILLKQSAISMEGVEVSAEREPISYQIDKKVINVARHYTATTGTAVDVLENVPSVTVDIEGNVSLRGSSSFMVLIDGRPSILDPNDALKQIPASSIENIEIITNPSAKYDPDGTSGILNILLKKNSLNGSNGIMNLRSGLEDKYGADILLNYRRGDLNASIGADWDNRIHPGTGHVENVTTHEGINSYIFSDGAHNHNHQSYGIRGMLDYHFSSRDVLGFALSFGGRAGGRSGNQNYDQWAEPDLIHYYYLSKSESDRSGNHYEVNSNYQHQFAKKGHELSAQFTLSHRESEEFSVNERFEFQTIQISGRRSTEDGPSTRGVIKIDYILPLNRQNKFEAGGQAHLSRSRDITGLSDFNPATGIYDLLPQFGHTIDYNQDIHSVYSIYSGEIGKLGYQGGLRGEYTFRVIELAGENEKFQIDRRDFYPTFHSSYKISEKQQAMASYTRRIERPHGWDLEPFETWMDAYNVRKGNPALQPEYIDSYELGYQTFLGANMFSAEAYYRVTRNKKENVRSVYADNITLHTSENVGQNYAFGTELMLNFDPFKWWNLNTMGNLYQYKIEGALLGESFSRESFSWSMRINNAFKLTGSTRLQINNIYNSESVSSQGRRKGFVATNVALRQEFFERSFVATLQVNDIFKTSKYESITEGTNFYSYAYFKREAPVVMLNLSYNINNYKPERKREGRDENGEDFEEF